MFTLMLVGPLSALAEAAARQSEFSTEIPEVRVQDATWWPGYEPETVRSTTSVPDGTAGLILPSIGVWKEAGPPSRTGHCAAYDGKRHRLVIFGGTDGVLRNDAWVLPLHPGGQWEELEVTGSLPPARIFAAMVYDPLRDRVLLFGGSEAWVSGSRLFDDVWELSFSGGPQWRQLSLEPPGPSARAGTSAIYDPVGDQVILCGGLVGGGGRSADTWILSLAEAPRWRLVTPGGEVPAPRMRHAAAYDAPRNRMLVFGGSGQPMRDDLYALSLGENPTWSRIVAGGTPPPNLYAHHALCEGDRMYSIGGEHSGGIQAGNWALHLDGEPRWAPLNSPPMYQVISGHVAVLDSKSHRLVIHGGVDHANDTWSFDLNTGQWLRLAPRQGSPLGRAGHPAVYDRRMDRMITLGWHYGGDLDGYVEPWQLTLSGQPEWSPIHPPGRPNLAGNVIAFLDPDPAQERILVVGTGARYVATIPELDLSSEPRWIFHSIVGTVPTAPGWLAGTLDEQRRRLLVFGLGPRSDETWALELKGGMRWTRVSAENPPPAEAGRVAVYDSRRDRILLLGWSRHEVWSLPLSGPTTWTRILPGATPPDPWYGSTVIYDERRDRLIALGSAHSGSEFSIWTLSLGDPSGWKPCRADRRAPANRGFSSAVFDGERDRILMFGGSKEGALRDAWFLQLGPDPPVSTRSGSAAALVRETIPGASPVVEPQVIRPFAGARLDIRIVSSASTRNGLGAEITLPGDEPATLDVFDLAGRRRASWPLAGLNAGVHRIDWHEPGAADGLYWLRLRQGANTATARAIVIR